MTDTGDRALGLLDATELYQIRELYPELKKTLELARTQWPPGAGNHNTKLVPDFLELVEHMLGLVNEPVLLSPPTLESYEHLLGGMRVLLEDRPLDDWLKAQFDMANAIHSLSADDFWTPAASGFKTDDVSRNRLKGINGRCNEYLNQLRDDIQISVIGTAKEATQAAAAAKEAAGEVGTSSLSAHFAEFSRLEGRMALYRQSITVVLVVMVVAVGFYGAFIKGVPDRWTAGILLKATLSLPLLALAYYFAREASVHASTARRAREIEVRLRTIRAYTSELPAADRVSVRTSFANSLFGVLDFGSMDGQTANVLGKELTDTVKILADTVSSIAVKKV